MGGLLGSYLVAQYRRYAPPPIHLKGPLSPRTTTGTTVPGSLRVLTCNVQGLPGMQDLERISEFLLWAKPLADVICLQEVFSIGCANACDDALSDWHRCSTAAYASGLYVASRRPIIGHDAMHFSTGRWADSLVSKGALRTVIATGHPSVPHLTLATVHLQSDALLASQFAELTKFLGNRDCIVVGDFNTPPTVAHPLLGISAKLLTSGKATHEEGELDYGVEMPGCGPMRWTCRSAPVALDYGPADHLPLIFTLQPSVSPPSPYQAAS